MDEESLQAALHTYDAQLQQVELALGAGLEPSELADLRQLRGDLQELIELTEASLVSVRKSKLLAALDGERAAPGDADSRGSQQAGPAAPAAPGPRRTRLPSASASPSRHPAGPGRGRRSGPATRTATRRRR